MEFQLYNFIAYWEQTRPGRPFQMVRTVPTCNSCRSGADGELGRACIRQVSLHGICADSGKMNSNSELMTNASIDLFLECSFIIVVIVLVVLVILCL